VIGACIVSTGWLVNVGGYLYQKQQKCLAMPTSIYYSLLSITLQIIRSGDHPGPQIATWTGEAFKAKWFDNSGTRTRAWYPIQLWLGSTALPVVRDHPALETPPLVDATQ
jgi:hypothetical protein